MKQNLFKTSALLLFVTLLFLASGCKKDQIKVDQTKVFGEDVPKNDQPDLLAGGWVLTLNTDGTADIIPGGDIIYRGTYKINGDKIKVRATQTDTPYTFIIISETQIKEQEYGTILNLR